MKVLNSKTVNDKILSYVESVQLNNAISHGITHPLSERIIFNDYADVKRSAKKFQKLALVEDIHYTDDEALLASMLLGMMKVGECIPFKIINDIIAAGRVFHEGCFDDNAYLKNILFSDITYGEYELTYEEDAQYEMFFYDIPIDKYQGVQIPRVGCFDHKYKYPCIKKNGEIWRSVTPNEIFAMEKPLSEARGNVLKLGCGTGYYAYMASEKEEVEKITIIEHRKEIRELFLKYILPQFKNKGKIEVVDADA